MNVYIVDDDSLVLASLNATLGDRFEVQTFEGGEPFLSELHALAPGVVVLDLSMPRMDGLAVYAQLLERHAPLAVVFLTGSGGIPEAVEAIRRGAANFLSKPIRRADLISAVDRASQTLESFLSQQRCKVLLTSLSQREQQVLKGLASGTASKEIAYQLGISLRTVEMHRAGICKKLGVSTTAAVAMMCGVGVSQLAA